jgi:hypothetical protein
VKARLEAMRQQTELLQAIGVLPKHLGQLQIHIDQRRVAMTIIAKLKEHAVPLNIQEDIVHAIEAASGKSVPQSEVPKQITT